MDVIYVFERISWNRAKKYAKVLKNVFEEATFLTT